MNKINVLLACFNGMQFLRDQIQSIAEQENVHINLFIADDGFTDGSIAEIESFKITGAIKAFNHFLKHLLMLNLIVINRTRFNLHLGTL